MRTCRSCHKSHEFLKQVPQPGIIAPAQCCAGSFVEATAVFVPGPQLATMHEPSRFSETNAAGLFHVWPTPRSRRPGRKPRSGGGGQPDGGSGNNTISASASAVRNSSTSCWASARTLRASVGPTAANPQPAKLVVAALLNDWDFPRRACCLPLRSSQPNHDTPCAITMQEEARRPVGRPRLIRPITGVWGRERAGY